ncbi:MAG: hypothetical protein QME68_01765 [Elusimicrobiota bacterium]|nr:hypothetical protein [Elusimicrobiota bacterium]
MNNERWKKLTTEELLLSAGAEFSRLTNLVKRNEREYSLNCIYRAEEFIRFLLNGPNEKKKDIEYLHREIQTLRNIVDKKFSENKKSIIKSARLISKVLMFLGGYSFGLE